MTKPNFVRPAEPIHLLALWPCGLLLETAGLPATKRKSELDCIGKQLGIKESTLAAYSNSMGKSTRRFGKGTSHPVSRKRLPGGVKCAHNTRVPGSISIMELT